MERARVFVLSLTATILLGAAPPASAENNVPGTPEAVTTSQLPPDLRATFQADLEAGEMSGLREQVIGGYISDLQSAQRESEQAGQTPPPEIGAAIEALQRLGAYDDARIAASELLTPEQRAELQKDWASATTMAGRERAVLGRLLRLQQDISQAEAFNRQASGAAEIPTDQMRAAAEALRRLIWAMATATSPVATPTRAATEDDGMPDRRQGDARIRSGRDHLLEGYAAGRRDGARPGPKGGPIKQHP